MSHKMYRAVYIYVSLVMYNVANVYVYTLVVTSRYPCPFSCDSKHLWHLWTATLV